MVEERYIRNIGVFTEKEQNRLENSKVVIVGQGGLGGVILEELIRAGVGNIRVIDGDVFEESNLNRQILCTEKNLGIPKVETALKRASEVNSSVNIEVVNEYVTKKNAHECVSGADIVIDALDNVESRLILSGICTEMGITLVHGGIWGWNLEIAVISPGSKLMEKLYAGSESGSPDKRSVSCTVFACASLEVSEALKVLLRRPLFLENKVLYADLETMDASIEEI